MTTKLLQCAFCQHFRRNDRTGNYCVAFPDGIPEPIIRGEADHSEPYPGDNGIRFTPLLELTNKPKSGLRPFEGVGEDTP